MGRGIELARPGAPLHAAVLDDLKDQLILALFKRLGALEGPVTIPAAEIDETGNYTMAFRVDPETRAFDFILQRKQ